MGVGGGTAGTGANTPTIVVHVDILRGAESSMEGAESSMSASECELCINKSKFNYWYKNTCMYLRVIFMCGY